MKHLFAPTSQSLMSKFFGDSESLRKSNGKKGVSDLKTFAHKGCKLAATKKSFLQIFSFVFLPPFPKSNVQTF